MDELMINYEDETTEEDLENTTDLLVICSIAASITDFLKRLDD